MKKLILSVILFSLALPVQALMCDQIETYGKYIIAPDAEMVKVVKEKDMETSGTQVIKRDRNGYYVDERFQVPESSRIPPPHPENIPKEPRATRTVIPFDSYYDINVLGIRREPRMTPVIPNYNIHYSERRANPYTKEDFINVWCDGIKFQNGVDCQTKEYAITFAKAEFWSGAVVKAPFKAKKVNC